jgi:glycosyltransferase involved in cell wall biosynthesis
MSEKLARRGHSVHLLTYGSGSEVTGKGFSHERIRRLPGDQRMRSGPSLIKPVLDVLMVRSLLSLVVREKIDVIHAHNYEATIAGIVVGTRRRVPVIYHSHNLMSDELPTYFARALASRAAGMVGRTLDRHVPRRADHAIALCRYSADILERAGVASERLSVIPPAVDDSETWGPRNRARARLGIDEDAEVVGYLGNVDRYQNLELLFAAVRESLDRGRRRRLRLLIASHGVDAGVRGLLARYRVDEQAYCVAVGGFDEGKRAIEACDILTLPRRLGSGYPIKLLNYMSSGRPIVTAGCGAKVLSGGLNALVVADDAPVEMADAIERLLGDPGLGKKLAAGARRLFLSSLTWNSVLPCIEEIYDHCIRLRDADARGESAGRVTRAC